MIAVDTFEEINGSLILWLECLNGCASFSLRGRNPVALFPNMGWHVSGLPGAEIMHLNWWMGRKTNSLLRTINVVSVTGLGECVRPTIRRLS